MSAQSALRNGVETRWPERTTPHETAQGQPRTSTSAIRGECLVGVFGTGRKEAAWRRATFPCPLIPLDQADQGSLHAATSFARDEKWATASLTSENEGSSAASRTMPKRYKPGLSADERIASRRRRRMRFLITAEPAERPMAKAMRGAGNDESGSMEHQITPRRTRVPSWRSRRKSCPRRSRSIKPTGGGGP